MFVDDSVHWVQFLLFILFIRKDAKLPTGFVFLKRKKQFLKGRTLISYFRSYYAVLMQVTARTIDSMCVQLWPQTFGQLSVPNIWRAIHEHFTVASEEITFDVINDDSIGFFNSIPQHRLLDAVHSLVAAWKQHHGDTVLSVDVSLKGPAMYTTYVGQFRKAHSPGRSVLPDHIFEIVAASLKSNIFLALNQVWKQFRGAGIGAHISPSLSNLAVTIVERTWAYTFRDAINSPSLAFMGLRYVDNRFVCSRLLAPNLLRLQSWLTQNFMNSRSNLSQLTPRNSWGFLWIIEIALFNLNSPNYHKFETCTPLAVSVFGFLA